MKSHWMKYGILMVALFGFASCASTDTDKGSMTMKCEGFGALKNGQKADLYTLTNPNGMVVKITNFGGIVTSIVVPDKDGVKKDVALGFDELSGYENEHPYFGAIVGRYGNRIAEGKFVLDGKTYTLAVNNGPNHLHGGIKGFDKVIWTAEPVGVKDGIGIQLKYLSKDGEEGYPGKLDCTIVYTLNKKNELRIEYYAKTDKPTVANLTHHSYFNLAGHDSGTILDQELMIAADRFTPVDKGLIPTGELKPVKGTPFDFTSPIPIGERIGAKNRQLIYGNGYDHNFVLNNQSGELALAATAHDPKSGRFMEVLTTEPGIQFYCGNFLDGSNVGKDGAVYEFRNGFCLETQHYPDSPNQKAFPSVVLKPGDEYRHTTIYRFSVK